MMREYTDKAFELVIDGVVSAETMLTSCLNYMSEASVAAMLRCYYGIDLDDDDDENDGRE